MDNVTKPPPGAKVADITELPPGKPINRHRMQKKVAKGVATATSIGVSAAQIGTGTGALALVAGAVSATGVGLVVTGGVLTVASALTSGRSAYKTDKHIDGLKDILTNRGTYDCSPVEGLPRNSLAHTRIAEQVLPYIIKQKQWKLGRKVASAVPGVGLLEGLRAISKKGYKYARGTLGVERDRAAGWLTIHFCDHHCGLTDAIITELYGKDEMIWLREQEAAVIQPLIADKLKST